MKRSLFFILPLALTLNAQANETAHWGYEGEGASANWAQLSPEFALCAKGVNQTPIDIHGALKSGLTPLKLHFADVGQTIVNNGHTIQVNVAEGDTLTLNGDTFTLQQ